MAEPGSTGTIHQISSSHGGVPKLPLPEAEIDERGVIGDLQADRMHHGHPHQALCLFPLERIQELQAQEHPIDCGSTGENITTEGLAWRLVVPGVRLRLGRDVRIEITDYASPCLKNVQWFKDGDISLISHTRFPDGSRVYARVLQGGAIRPGDPVAIEESTGAERAQRTQIPTVRWPADFPT